MDFLRKAGLIQWSLCGALLGSGFVFPILWFLSIVGVAYFLYLVQSAKTIKRVLIGGFLAWTVKALAALLWFFSVYPIDWLSFSLGKIQLLIISFYWLSASVWLGLGGMVVAFIIKKLHSITKNKILHWLIIPSIWVVGEMLGSLMFSVFSYGAGGTFTSAFSFGYVGYLLTQHQWLVQLAVLSGVYILSFVLVSLALVGLWLFKAWRAEKLLLLLLTSCVFFFSAYIPLPAFFWNNTTSQQYYSVLSIDTTFSAKQIKTKVGVEQKQQALEKAVQSALTFGPDYILLPEDARYFNQHAPQQQEKALFQFLHANPKTIIVDSGRVTKNEKTLLQSFIYNGQEDVVDSSEKRYLVPQGEYVPYLYAWILKASGYGQMVELMEQDMSYSVGSNLSQRQAATSTPGILFCFESVSPWGVRQIIKERESVPFIAHPISHAWFHQPRLLWQNLNSMLQVQAVWNRQYIISVGNQATSHVFTPQGEVLIPKIIAQGEGWTIRQTFVPLVQPIH